VSVAQLPDFLLAAQQDPRRDAPLGFLVATAAEPQELPFFLSSHCTLRLVHFKLQSACQKTSDTRPHSLPRSSAADIDVAVIRIPYQALPTPFEFAVEFVEYSISRWSPCPPKDFSFGRRRITAIFGYSTPHSSARGTSTLPNNTLLSTHYALC
jgi:hypothetical protein